MKALLVWGHLWDLEHGPHLPQPQFPHQVEGSHVFLLEVKQMASHVYRGAAFTALTGIVGV